VTGKSVLALAALVLAAGCAPQLDRIETELQANTDEVAKLRAEQQRLRQDVEAVNALLRLDRDSGTETEAQRLARLNQVSLKMDQLIQMLNDNSEYMRNLSARVDLLATRMGIPTLGDYKSAEYGGAAVDSNLAALPEEGRAIFRAAQLDRSRGNTALAREGLEEFLQKYGDSELADDAVYWLGDLAYGERQYSQALSHFQDLFDRFPESEFVPAGMLKSAYCLQYLGRDIESREYLRRLIDEYPDAPEAKQAESELADDT